MKKVLFITWDGPQTSYLEGLFLPIFSQIQNTSDYQFHIIQFTWGAPKNGIRIKQKAESVNIFYTKQTILRKPNAIIGSLVSIQNGINFLKNYIAVNGIDIVMPRSTMPSIMVNRIKDRKFNLVFDADGLPLEERIDFSGLSPNSFQYKLLKKEETKMLLQADFVFTRSNKAIKFHSDAIGDMNLEKFSVVTNGRDINFFKPSIANNNQIREELSLKKDTKVFIYSGSLGPQYGWDNMIKIFKRYLQINHNSVFLILTPNIEFATKRIPTYLHNHIIVKSVLFEEIPRYLAIGDIAFAIREPKQSMQGVAPIKLGEYLLMGIPTIASSGIGDTEDILSGNPCCFLFHHDAPDAIEKTLSFIEKTSVFNQNELREFGIKYFSIEASAASYINTLDHCL